MTLLGTPQEVSKKRAKTFPLGTPFVRAQTTLRYRYTHVCAKIYKFSFCARILIENRFRQAEITSFLVGIRKQENIACGHESSRTLQQPNFFASCNAPYVRKDFKENGKSKILARRLPAQSSRRRNPPSDALRQSRGRPRRERPGSLSFALSLWKDKERALCRARRVVARPSGYADS